MGKGCLAVLIGADGCGKTTIASLLMKELQAGGLMVRHQHWRPNVLPSPRTFIGQKPSSDPTRPHEKKCHSTVGSFLLSLYYFADFWFGYFFQMRPFIHRGGVIIAERYIYDMVFDPLRHRLAIPEKWTRYLCKSAPDPDLIVVLTGDPVILHERKRELNPLEISRQQNKLDTYFANYPKAIIISTTAKSVEVCTQIIIEHLQMI